MNSVLSTHNRQISILNCIFGTLLLPFYYKKTHNLFPLSLAESVKIANYNTVSQHKINFAIPIELLAKNLAYLRIICSVSWKKSRKLDKQRRK